MDDNIQAALRRVGFYSGYVLNESAHSEFLSWCGATPLPDKVKAFAVVIGASPEFIEAVRLKNVMATRITAFPSPMGRMLLVLTLQIGSWQCRNLFDLEVATTRSMLESIRSSGVLKLVFVTSEQSERPDPSCDVVEVDLKIAKQTAADLLNLAIGRGTVLNQYEHILDMACMAARLFQDRELLLIDGQPTPERIMLTDFIANQIEPEAKGNGTLH